MTGGKHHHSERASDAGSVDRESREGALPVFGETAVNTVATHPAKASIACRDCRSIRARILMLHDVEPN
jgi:hypothetical protein